MRQTVKLASALLAAYLIGALILLVLGRSEDVFPAGLALVLGSEVKADGSCAPRTVARLERAIRLYMDGDCQTIIVSGARGKSGYDEAVAMRSYLLARGIPEQAIVADGSGANTRKTAHFAAAYMARHGYSGVIAVSQYFHLPRVRLALEQAGIDKVGTACADFFEWRDVYSLAREFIGYPAYLIRLK